MTKCTLDSEHETEERSFETPDFRCNFKKWPVLLSAEWIELAIPYNALMSIYIYFMVNAVEMVSQSHESRDFIVKI